MHYSRADIAPPPPSACTSYIDLFGAVQGLLTFPHAECQEVFTRPLHRIREFTVANMDADHNRSPDRVQRTLHEVNHLGTVYVHLSSDSPFWWREFSAPATRIEFRSVAWSMTLQELPRPAGMTGDQPAPCTPETHPRSRPGSRDDDNRNHPARQSSIPAGIRALIPRDANGVEPCLPFYGGGMCSGGTRGTCADGRAHTWPTHLPTTFTNFCTRGFGRRRENNRHRA
ncbi:hypothetical protein JG688_00009838 [Phytophthora aleatoria]|uniref:Uncharacterized protein n=1 Tax=Phytophthora aleatoria TaxID=2496075 RepID=A0A8J5IT73_9STRA|nr:hypothetical protein JG688_00009838 [Phytophthora aleatoria]